MYVYIYIMIDKFKCWFVHVHQSLKLFIQKLKLSFCYGLVFYLFI